MNAWKNVPAGDKPPSLLNMVIEVVSGSRDKYEYSSRVGILCLGQDYSFLGGLSC